LKYAFLIRSWNDQECECELAERSLNMDRRSLSALIFVAVLGLGAVPAWSTICGSASFNHDIDWPGSSDVYFYIAGAPANTCGNLWGWRNGSGYQLEAAGWICTDGYGQATKGPWSVNNHSSDETAFNFIDWGSCVSNEVKHIFDVTKPTATITSSPPADFSGTASDGTWGAGFDSSWDTPGCRTANYDATSDKWYNSTIFSYSSSSFLYDNCSLSGMPSLTVTWSASQVPSSYSHTSGHHYYWYVQVFDGGQWSDWAVSDFTY